MTTHSGEEARGRGTEWTRRAARILIPAVLALGMPLVAATPATAASEVVGECAGNGSRSAITGYEIGGRFTPDISGTADGATIQTGRYHGSSNQPIQVRLREIVGGQPGPVLAQGDLPTDGLVAGSFDEHYVPFDVPAALQAGTTYLLSHHLPSDASSYTTWYFGYSGSCQGGSYSYDGGTTWYGWNNSIPFQIAIGDAPAGNPKELRWSGQGGTIGSTDASTVVSLDERQTWQPAYIVGGDGSHPWDDGGLDIVDSRAAWINCGPSFFVCLNRGAWYKTFLVMPETGPYSLRFRVMADNYADVYINGTQVGGRIAGAGSFTVPPELLHAGVNTFEMYAIDAGGWAGFRYDVFGTFDTDAVVDEDGDGEVDVPNTPPTIADNDDMVAEATGADGAVVTFDTPAVTDAEEPELAATCSPVSGSTFELGDSVVTCSVTDAAGESAESSFTVTVQDTIAPEISFSGNAGTYGVDGQVAIECAADDAVTPGLTCAGATGPAYAFGLGEETVTGSATDAAGNGGSGDTTFTVVVDSTNLCSLTAQLVDQKGIANSLCVKLRAGSHRAYRNELKAQSGKKVPASAASLLSELSLALG
jgi:hypothetical protein